MLDIRRLRMLHEFAARGSIARTAEALGYTPSAVSQQLAVLEREAGTPLLDRTARSAGLTPAGRRLAAHAERILAMVEEAESDLSAQAAQPSGRVVVTAFPSAAVAFAPALARSLRAHPKLSLLLREASPAEGLQLVRSGEVEVAIVDDWTGRMSAMIAGPPAQAAIEGNGAGSEHGQGGVLSYYHLVRDPLVLVVARDHPAANPDRPVDLRALRNEPWLAAPSGEPSRQATDRLLAAVGLTPPVPSEFEGLGTVANLVARGMGISIMPRLAVGAYERRLVVRELPAGLDLARDIFAVARTASVARPSVAVIVNALRGAARSMSRSTAAHDTHEAAREIHEPQQLQGPREPKETRDAQEDAGLAESLLRWLAWWTSSTWMQTARRLPPRSPTSPPSAARRSRWPTRSSGA